MAFAPAGAAASSKQAPAAQLGRQRSDAAAEAAALQEDHAKIRWGSGYTGEGAAGGQWGGQGNICQALSWSAPCLAITESSDQVG